MEKEKTRKLNILKIKELLVFPFRLMIRPFKRFDDLKERKNVSYYFGLIILILFGVVSIIEYQYIGFILNTNNPNDLNAITILITSIIPLLLAIVANWSVTTFLDGKGNIKDIFLLLTYSLVPLLICRVLGVILSNFITTEDQVFVKILVGLGAFWSGSLIFVGLVVVHEYSFGKNILNLILTAIAFCVILFLILLVFNLIQRVFGFSQSLLDEIIYRIRG